MIKIGRDQVEFILSEFSETRDSDLSLGNRICQVYHLYLPTLDWVSLANFISRERRRFQNQGLYLPNSEKVKKRRGQLKEIYRNEYTQTKDEIQSKALLAINRLGGRNQQ